MKQHILRIVLLPVLLGLLLFMFSAMSTPRSAHAASMIPAGSNGQQLAITTYFPSVWIVGTNQNGIPVKGCLNILAPPPRYTWLPGYWWKGYVYFYFYRNSGCSIKDNWYIRENVPTSQNGDWYYVNAY